MHADVVTTSSGTIGYAAQDAGTVALSTATVVSITVSQRVHREGTWT